MSDTTRAADSKSQLRGLESDGANPSEPADVLDALAERLHQWVHACPGDGTCGSMACHVGYYTFIEHAAANDLLAFFTEQQLVVVKAPGLSHGDELEPVGFNGHLRVVPRTPAADEACEHCDDGIVWEDGVVGSCCEVCGGVGVVLSPENGDTQ